MSQIPIGWLINRRACLAHQQRVMMIDGMPVTGPSSDDIVGFTPKCEPPNMKDQRPVNDGNIWQLFPDFVCSICFDVSVLKKC